MTQMLKVLLWKTYVLRKRQWIITLLEIILPILLFWFLVHFSNPTRQDQILYDTSPTKYNYIGVGQEYKIAYTPSNINTDSIMNTAVSSLQRFGSQVTMAPQSSEDEVVTWLRQQYLSETKNSTSVFGNDDYSPGLGIIFLNSDSTKLEYVLRTTKGNVITDENSLYGEQSGNSEMLYASSGFLTIQTAIDQAYLSQIHGINVPDSVLIETLPSLGLGSINIVPILLPYIVTIAFTFVMPSLLRGIIEEKTSGIKEMMKIMGLRSWANWINWAVFSMVVNVPVTLVVSGLLTLGEVPLIDAHILSVWGLFLLFTLSFVVFIFAFSTFFTHGIIAVVVGEIMWNTVTSILNTLIISLPDKFGFWFNLLVCLWPSLALQWALNTMNNFQKNGHPWTISDFFDDGAGGGRVSVGLAAIMLVVDIVLYGLITWYMDSIKPGPYGRAKPFTFMFQCFKKRKYGSKATTITDFHANYEPPPRGIKVGIRIENLHKTFNGDKVVAVKNVDLDIYEGNITTLLGHNGAGKTTTMSILTGLFSPTRGKVIVDGKNIFDNMDEFRSSLGLCPQHNLLFTYFTVQEHLVLFGMLKGLTSSQSQREGQQLLKTLNMEEKLNVMVSKLSGGMKRRLSLAISLMGDPKVLVLDEPTSGLDPESRRQVWDVLLGFRGHRTIIISTHFMEEADVLGDRIAIMDHGQVSCYGTSMFLKKLYSTGYHLDISKKEQAAPALISRVVQQYVTSATVKLSSSTQLSYNIKSDETSQFPALFAALDNWKQNLGLTGVSLTSTTLEDVFLKVAEEPDNVEQKNGENNNVVFIGKYKKNVGCSLLLTQFIALFYKRILTRKRTWISTVIFMLIPILAMTYTINRSMEEDYSPIQPRLLLSLSSFPRVHVAVSSDDQAYSTLLQQLVTSDKATYEAVPTRTDLDYYLAGKINNSLIQYERQIIAGFKYDSKNFIGGYSQYFVHSSALVLNLVANTLLRLKNPSSIIITYNHPISIKSSANVCDLYMLSQSHVFLFPMIMTYLSLGLLILAMSFISFPLKERVSGGKQLQLMTGVSPVLYWTSTFLCDLLMYLLTAALMLATAFIFQKHNIYSSSGLISTAAVVFALSAISSIPFAYFFSFLANSPNKASVLFIIISTMTGTIAAVLLSVLGRIYTDYTVYTFILSFNPIFSASSAFMHLFSVMYINGVCNECGANCQTQDVFTFLDTGMKAENPHGINNFLIFLVVDTVIFLSLVLFIEYGIMKRLWFYISKMWIKMDDSKLEEDSDVLNEKEKVKVSSQIVQGLIANTAVLKVNDLGKKYNKATTAVHGVSFRVEKGECFGLLGVNGAGKTTTFKMLTGEEIPNKGDATVQNTSLHKHKSKFLARIGYCPQFDAINKLLTGKEMLHVYAQLRGIPSTHRHAEVKRWVQIMGLKEYADRPCGTYSGGNKRKLSTAMAFIGEPPVVFLDEPTSGVDPVSRRKLWDVVAKCQQAGQAIVLTSHSMEECEALCSRLTIMVAGQMKCIGSAQYLKHKFGQGYTVKLKLQSSKQYNAVDMLKQDVARHFTYSTIKDEHTGLLHYHIPHLGTPLSRVFANMEHLKRTHNIIEDYTVSDTTLEQVFMSFARGDISVKP